MPTILRFKIEGLAGRSEPLERRLDPFVNLFWGLNGGGKTSLLKLMHAALDNDTISLSRIPFKSAEFDFWSKDSACVVRRTFDKSQLTPDSMELSQEDYPFDGSSEPEEIRAWRQMRLHREQGTSSWKTDVVSAERKTSAERRGDLSGSTYRHVYLPISRLSRSVRMSRDVRSDQIDDAILDEEFAALIRRSWRDFNGNALAEIEAIQRQGLANVLALLFGGTAKPSEAPQGIVEPTATTGNEAYDIVREFLRSRRMALHVDESEFITRYNTAPELRAVVATIEETLNQVSVLRRPQETMQQIIEKLYRGAKHLELEPGGRGDLAVTIAGKTIPLQLLSSGEKQLLRMLLAVLGASDLPVIIDEPELSLHVDWQRELVPAMRQVNPNCQLILATHSPEVMAETPDECVLEL
jgi:hypothetical protein